MLLDTAALRALVTLKQRHNDLMAARATYLAAEAACWQAGVSHRQIAAITGDKPHTVYRRLRGEIT